MEVRQQFAKIIRRFMAGDQTLHSAIDANAASGSPVAELARGACNDDNIPVEEDPDTRRKRIKRDELEMLRMQVEIEERRANTMRNLQETQEMRMRGIEYSMQLLDRLNPTWQKSDARFRMQTEDMVKNILTVPVTTASLLTYGEPSKQQATLSISQLAQELGCKKLLNSQLSLVGSRAARLFRTRYGKEPTKHRQWVDGAERDINTYTEADRPLLTQVFVDMGLVPGSASSVASSDE